MSDREIMNAKSQGIPMWWKPGMNFSKRRLGKSQRFKTLLL